MQSAGAEPLFPWLTRFCAYRERCISEVRLKLKTRGFVGEAANEFIERLQEQDYLSEERYARMFAGGHFRQKQWGRRKIEAALRAKGIKQSLIMQALGELSPAEYTQALLRLAEKTWRQQTGHPEPKRWARVRATLLRKGYESALISGIQHQIVPGQKKR